MTGSVRDPPPPKTPEELFALAKELAEEKKEKKEIPGSGIEFLNNYFR